MRRSMKICGGDVELPGGVVAQEIFVDNSKPDGHVLQISKRYPLGLFVGKDLVDEYRMLLEDIEVELVAWGKRKGKDSPSYWSKYMKNQFEIDAFDESMAVVGAVLGKLGRFIDGGVEVNVCHRSRISETSHRPIVDRWIEFTDLDIAPTGYRSLWSLNSTIIMPVCVCIGGGFELMQVIIPNVGILKLLRDQFLQGIPDRLSGLLKLKGLQQEFENLIEGLNRTMKLKAGFWDANAVDQVIQFHRQDFLEKGIDIWGCKLYSLSTLERLFQWIEFVDIELLPNYEPQYGYKKSFLRHRGNNNNNNYRLSRSSSSNHQPELEEYKIDPITNEKYLKNYHRLNALAKSHKIHKVICKKAPPSYWEDDEV